MREEGGSADFVNLGSRPTSKTPLSFSIPFQTPLLFRFKFDCVFKSEHYPNKFQIKPKELQVSHTNVFLYFLGISFSSKINLGIKGEERKTSLNNLLITHTIHRKFLRPQFY
jgi:hypothetical protein